MTGGRRCRRVRCCGEMLGLIGLRARIALVVTSCAVAVLAQPAGAAASGWAIQTTPNPPRMDGLNDVSCPTVKLCVAVGGPEAEGTAAIAELWNGTGWSVTKILAPSRARSTQLNGVSCVSRTACTAVGYYDNRAMASFALIERWNGTKWSIQTASSPPGPNGTLNGISCTSRKTCMAVGSYGGGGGFPSDKLLAEHWNGTRWSTGSPVTPAGGQEDSLNGISCTADKACTAVGYGKSTLVERWNGTAWSLQPSPKRSGSEFISVSCTSSKACMAVGSYSTSTREVTLAEVWHGAHWSIVKTPAPADPAASILDGVSCTSQKSCISVGTEGGDGGPSYVLAEAWNGSRWSTHHTPDPADSDSSGLMGVSCISSNACTAVGSSNGPPSTTLAERFMG